jgi:transposase
MGKPYSDDLRDRVVAAMAAGRRCRDVGSMFAVAPSTAGNWHRRHQRTQSHAARPTGGDRRSKLTEHADWIADRLARTSELTLGEVRDELAGRSIVGSYASVWRTVRRLGLRHKKRTIFATEQDRLDVTIARDIWRAAQAGLAFTRLVFVDETGTTTSMTRLRGWGLRGRPLLGKAPHGHWMTSTFVAGLAHDGIHAPMLIDTPMTGLIFQQWLTEHLPRNAARQHRRVRQPAGPQGRRRPTMPRRCRQGPALPAALQP